MSVDESRVLWVNWTPHLSLIHVSELLHRQGDGEGEVGKREKKGWKREDKSMQGRAEGDCGRSPTGRQQSINQQETVVGWRTTGAGRMEDGKERPESKQLQDGSSEERKGEEEKQRKTRRVQQGRRRRMQEEWKSEHRKGGYYRSFQVEVQQVLGSPPSPTCNKSCISGAVIGLGTM